MPTEHPHGVRPIPATWCCSECYYVEVDDDEPEDNPDPVRVRDESEIPR